jgi:hypothetical protein
MFMTYWPSISNLFNVFSTQDPAIYKRAKEILQKKYFHEEDTVIAFCNALLDANAVISGDIVLEFLEISVDRQNILDVYVNITKVSKIIEAMILRGYNLIYVDDNVVLSNTCIYDAQNYAYITKICHCNKDSPVNRCLDPRCIKGTIRLNICTGSPDNYINRKVEASYQRLKFDGREIYDEYLESTREMRTECVDDPNVTETALSLGFTVSEKEYIYPQKQIDTLCDIATVAAELVDVSSFRYLNSLRLYEPLPVIF